MSDKPKKPRKKGSGGARPGCGRKPGAEPYKGRPVLSVALRRADLEAFRQIADEQNETDAECLAACVAARRASLALANKFFAGVKAEYNCPPICPDCGRAHRGVCAKNTSQVVATHSEIE